MSSCLLVVPTNRIWTTRPKDNSSRTISPRIYNVLAVCFLSGFSTNDSILYVLVVYFLQTFLSCIEIKVFHFEVKVKERLVGSVEMQSDICERRWSMLLEQNNRMWISIWFQINPFESWSTEHSWNERRSCETKKWACSNLCKIFISDQETAQKKSQIIFRTTCYRSLITFAAEKLSM